MTWIKVEDGLPGGGIMKSIEQIENEEKAIKEQIRSIGKIDNSPYFWRLLYRLEALEWVREKESVPIKIEKYCQRGSPARKLLNRIIPGKSILEQYDLVDRVCIKCKEPLPEKP